jgi:hypothetical protein
MPWPVPTWNSLEKYKDIYTCERTAWMQDQSIASYLPTRGKIHKNIHESLEGVPKRFSRRWRGPNPYTQIQSSDALTGCIAMCLILVNFPKYINNSYTLPRFSPFLSVNLVHKFPDPIRIKYFRTGH